MRINRYTGKLVRRDTPDGIIIPLYGNEGELFLPRKSINLGENLFPFDYGTGFNNHAQSLLFYNNCLIVGGEFSQYKQITANNIVSLNFAGAISENFNFLYGFNSNIYSFKVDSNGKIYVGGYFTSYNGIEAKGIIRLNTDGSKDASFDNLNAFNSGVRAIAIDANGKIYVGGIFNSYKGVTANYIIRLNSDGSKDSSFDNTTGFDGSVWALKVDSSNKLLVGGQFSNYKGVSAKNIIRLNSDGSKDSSFDNTTGTNGLINSFEIDSNDKIYVAGIFSTYKGIQANRIIRLNSDGSKDTNFDNSTGFNNSVNKLLLHNNKIYALGSFTTYKTISAVRAIRLNNDGTIDTSFNTGVGFDNAVNDMVIANDKLYFVGNFTSYKGISANRIISLNLNGSINS